MGLGLKNKVNGRDKMSGVKVENIEIIEKRVDKNSLPEKREMKKFKNNQQRKRKETQNQHRKREIRIKYNKENMDK